MTGDHDFRGPFETRAKELLLSKYPELAHEWTREPNGLTLRFPPRNADEFEVWAHAAPSSMVVGAEAAHHHFEFHGRPVDDIVRSALGMIRDLLSPAMRLCERRSNGRPYLSVLEFYKDGEWKREELVGAIFYNWFGQRTERVRQNHHLPARSRT